MVLFSIVFGPGVAIVGTLHSILHVNLWAMQWLRNSCMSTKRRLAVKISRLEDFPPLMHPVSSNQYIDNTLHPRDLGHLGFWINDLPWAGGKLFVLFSWTVIKCLTSFIPIVGLFAVGFLESSTTGWQYCDSLRPGVGYYEDFAKFKLFGLCSGMLDMIPIVSGLTFTTNSIGCGLMMKHEY
ncbi:uncharacterized protein Ecym_1416 [Eremothecium cymbalariae DBVPG|uniref:Uncharacterized protein n=1 Tax=Eremothecium cymbalariae (strain CBS 270.75 / DBVPG 7215 / KCTC 17166 / NRRL Y-17582) TaxID=931890 RepID=G8JM73_ERECY|nr:hypothetical protein Ecym_1416 [Eremothecium cymbalariae DBVPG\